MNAVCLQQVIDHLWPDGDSLTGGQVYALLDGARDTRIEPMVRLSRLEYSCLYAGSLSPRLQVAAPYLIHLAPESQDARNLIELGWGNSWGIFTIVPADVTLQIQRRHFRTLLRVQDEAERILAFRFYDPRVLRVYLPTCTGEEAIRFFGPVPCIVVEAAQSSNMIKYMPGKAGARMETILLDADAAACPTGPG